MNLLDIPPPGPLKRYGAECGGPGPVRHKSKSNRFTPLGSKPTGKASSRVPLAIKIPPVPVFDKLPPLPSTPKPMSTKAKTASSPVDELPPLPSTPIPMSTKAKTASNKLSPEDLFAAAFGTPMEQVEVGLKHFGLKS